MARLYTEEDAKRDEAVLRKKQEEFEKKDRFEQERILRWRSESIGALRHVRNALNASGKKELNRIQCSGLYGTIERAIDPNSLRVIAENGETLILDRNERKSVLMVINAHNVLKPENAFPEGKESLECVFKVDGVGDLRAKAYVEPKYTFYLSHGFTPKAERIPDERLEEKVAFYKEVIWKRAEEIVMDVEIERMKRGDGIRDRMRREAEEKKKNSGSSLAPGK